MANRLASETSPYLLQHKNNPVDWYGWGDEAFEKAKTENKPIFLSIGYSACHWCHVMEHESFEDEATAAIMNERFVNVKVDREERPDVDAIYMSAVQAMTGHGGWPMSVWLLPDGRPFYGGTYFPNVPRYNMPSFKDMLVRIADVYRERQDAIERDAANLTQAITRSMDLAGAEGETLSRGTLEIAFQRIASTFDAEWGGFGDAPKFPPSMTLELLFRLHHNFGWQHALTIATRTLDRMAWGGMYDQLGGGFHRYSVDAHWLVPHFEKMLYDNALLIRAYLFGHHVTGNVFYRRIVEETIAYVKREMTSPVGGFYSSQDADSEGEEGKFFVWSEEELRKALAGNPLFEAVLEVWGVTAGPNFEGHSIIWVPNEVEQVAEEHSLSVDALNAAISEAREVLFPIREKRVHPGRDDKILSAWNGLMIKSLAEAGRALGNNEYVSLAGNAADFVLREMRRDGRLLRSYKDGQAKIAAFLEDYAFMAEALIELYQSTFELRWYEEALALTDLMVDLFWDDASGFYDTARDQHGLIARPQEMTDNALPSGTSSAVAVLLRMAIYADRPDWREKSERVLARLTPAIQQYPSAFAYLACQYDFATGAPHEIALVGAFSDAGMQALLDVINEEYHPNKVMALKAQGDERANRLIPLLNERAQIDGNATAYVCRNYVCQLPVSNPDALKQELERPSEH